MSLISNEKDAVRLARTIMSDIALYNQDKIRQSIKNDSLFMDMADQLEEGRRLYDSRVDPEMPGRWIPYNRAIVDVLVKRFGDIDSESFLFLCERQPKLAPQAGATFGTPELLHRSGSVSRAQR